MKIVVLGNSKFTISCFEALKKKTKNQLVLVSQKKNFQPKNSINMKAYAKKNNINFFETSNINSISAYKFLKSLNIDLIFSSWPKIISKKIINIPRLGTIGSHPTSLPKNKGRHPLHWLINLGCKNSHLSFFFMDESIDGGRLISRYKYQIKKDENIRTLESKIEKIAFKSCYDVYKKVIKKNFLGTLQDNKNSNYFRKRHITDLIVNLKMNFESIKKLVNSYSEPYEGAIIIINYKIFRIIKINKIYGDLSNVEIGKILKRNNSSIVTRCSDSLIKIYLKDLKKVDLNSMLYIHDPAYYLVKSKSFFKKLNKMFKENQ
tara:strand:+ start:727 stop:1683 length:957 start_codon:yes stop_codon:yes gene_type:complete